MKAELMEALNALEAHKGNQSAAARSLGIHRGTLAARVNAARSSQVKDEGTEINAEFAEMETRLRAMTAEVSRLQADAITSAAIRHKIIGLANAVPTTTAPEWLCAAPTLAGSPGVPTLFASDWHAGEVVEPSQIGGVNEFNVEIFERRVRVMVERTVQLLRIISPNMDYPGIVLVLGGDMVSGNIHDELAATNEINTMPTVLLLYGVISWAIDTLKKEFGKVFVPCVTGNHGRDTHKIWNKDRHATSFDWLLYVFLEKKYENDPDVQFLVPDGPDAYYKIYNHRYLLTHGDQFRGGDGMIGALGPITRGDHKKRSRNAQIGMDYDTIIMGHWHQCIFLRKLIVNGSIKGYDEYAYNSNFPFEPPAQQLWITHPKHGKTFNMPVYVDEDTELTGRAPEQWVSVFSRN